ncbi:MAG TPA: hypothetical protein VJQ06_02080 [Rhizomicrobium sp.]|nr:hypothetical protein [Rhizomicrobium sp.]
MNAIDASRALATATLRQGQAFENFQGAVRENVRDLCEALLQITIQTKTMSAEAENRFESLSDAMAVLSGHVASQRQEVQANIAATNQLAERLKQLQDEVAGQRAEAAQFKELMLTVASLAARVDDLDHLKGSVAQLAAEDAKLGERFAQFGDDLDTAKSQVAGLEDTVAALADSSIRSSEGLSVLGNALDAAKTQIFSLNQTSEYLTERLRIAEQVVERFTRREKILAGLHARAARTLQVGQ